MLLLVLLVLCMVFFLFQTGFQRQGSLAVPSCPPWQVEAAILKLHTRRVCCLAFPDNSELL